MIPAKFEYHRPDTLSEAVALLAHHGDDARVIAGGQSLTPMMKLRLAAPGHLVDLQAIAELRARGSVAGFVKIGATCRQAELITDESISRLCPLLREAALQIADPQVRNMGTIGGNVANGDPGNDMPGLMQCLNAVFALQGPKGGREVAARDYYEAAYVTSAADDEILTLIKIPTPPIGHGWAYEKQKRKIGDYATAAAAVLLTKTNGVCDSASIAMTNLGETPLFAEEAGKLLVGSTLDEAALKAAAKAAVAITEPAEDGRGPVEFKRAVAEVMLLRALKRAAGRAQ
ncbi:MAG: xanthine dehydrogenase family protein subunit M [Rhodobacteraceae bacterium]|nr:xanthine dehydrogenase family protein subunit M [Paracoccaceae bacterium]